MGGVRVGVPNSWGSRTERARTESKISARDEELVRGKMTREYGKDGKERGDERVQAG